MHNPGVYLFLQNGDVIQEQPLAPVGHMLVPRSVVALALDPDVPEQNNPYDFEFVNTFFPRVSVVAFTSTIPDCVSLKLLSSRFTLELEFRYTPMVTLLKESPLIAPLSYP